MWAYIHFADFMAQDRETKQEIVKEKCLQLLFGWECPGFWKRFSHIVELFILDAFVDLFITLCILINTAFMGMDHFGMSPEMAHTLVIGNYVSNIQRNPEINGGLVFYFHMFWYIIIVEWVKA